MERWFGAEGEVGRDLESNKVLLEAGVADEASRLKVLQLTTLGARVTFDPRSHKRVIKASDRLNYLFSMAKTIDRKSPDAFTQQILAHFYVAEEKFVTVFGNAEWEHLRANNFVLNQTPEDTQSLLKENLGEDVFAGIADTYLEKSTRKLRKK